MQNQFGQQDFGEQSKYSTGHHPKRDQSAANAQGSASFHDIFDDNNFDDVKSYDPQEVKVEFGSQENSGGSVSDIPIGTGGTSQISKVHKKNGGSRYGQPSGSHASSPPPDRSMSSKLQQSSRNQMQLQDRESSNLNTYKGSWNAASRYNSTGQGAGDDDEFDQALNQGYQHDNQQNHQQYSGYQEVDSKKGAQPVVIQYERMTRFQVAFVSATHTEADTLVAHINQYLGSRKHFGRDWSTKCKASSFLTQWMQITIPQVLENLTKPKTKFSVPGGNLNRLLFCLLSILDQGQEIYNTRYSSNPVELLQTLMKHRNEDFGETSQSCVKDDYLQRSSFHVSPVFINILESFCQSKGFDLLLLILEGNEAIRAQGFIAQFFLYGRILDLIQSLKEFLKLDYFKDIVVRLRNICLNYAKNKVDLAQLRHVSSRDQTAFIQRLERLLNSLLYDRRRQGEDCDQEEEVYNFTEQIELELALKCLRLPILEKKFIGHAIISMKVKQARSRVPTKSDQKDNEGRGRGQGQNHMSTLHQLRSRWPDKEKLIAWMDDNRIFDMMFGESLHPEVIKKSKDILEFLYFNGRIGEEQINVMWQCAMEKHEVYRVAILKALISLASIVKSKELRFIFEKVRALPASQIDKFMMLLLKTMAKNVAQTVDGNQRKNLTQGRINSRRFELIMGTQNNMSDIKKHNKPPRRSSDVGLQSKGLASMHLGGSPTDKRAHDLEFSPSGFRQRGSALGFGSSKISPWDDHDAAKIRREDAHPQDHLFMNEVRQKQSRGRSPIVKGSQNDPMVRSRSQGGSIAIPNVQPPRPADNKIPQSVPVESSPADKVADQLPVDPKEKSSGNSTGEENADITNVPVEKEDKNTADEDDSPKQIGGATISDNQLFDDLDQMDDNGADATADQNNQQFSKRNQANQPSSSIFGQEEEEKQAHSTQYQQLNMEQQRGADGEGKDSNERDSSKLSLKHLLFEIQIQSGSQNADNGLDPIEDSSMKNLAIEILKLMWKFCQEDMVALQQQQSLVQHQNEQNQLNIHQNQQIRNPENQIQDYLQVHNQGAQGRDFLSIQVHQVAIENLCSILTDNFHLSSFFFMNLCVQNLKRNRSAISSQVILQRLIEGTHFPIYIPTDQQTKKPHAQSPNQIDSHALNQIDRLAQRKIQQGDLPRNVSELIIALDMDLQITNECLSSYVEFKRSSVQLIFDQFGNMDNDMLGAMGGDQDENLETQSSLDNNTNQTAEERSRFSQSIVSSTQKSDTADYLTSMTRSQQKSSQKQRSSQTYGGQSMPQQQERGQSMPKHASIFPQNINNQELGSKKKQNNNLFDVEASSSTFQPVNETPDSGQLVRGEPSGSDGGGRAGYSELKIKDAKIQLNAMQYSYPENAAGGQTTLSLNSPGILGVEDGSKQNQTQLFTSTDAQQHSHEQEAKGKGVTVIKDELLGKRAPKSDAGDQTDHPLISLNQESKIQVNHQVKGQTQRSLHDVREDDDDSQEIRIEQKKDGIYDRESEADNMDSFYEKGSQGKSNQSNEGPSQIQTQTQQNQNQNRQFLNNLITNRALSLNFIQEMTKRLEFLKFLTKGSLCKSLKNAQINVLWECLVVNAFNEDERDQFFVFCTEVLNSVQSHQFKLEQRARNSANQQNGQMAVGDILAEELLFDEDCLEMIFFEILLRLDYKSSDGGCGFTPKMYQCFERYFIYINEQYGQIVVGSHALSSLLNSQTCDISSPILQFEVHDHQLIGIEALWEIILGAQDERIYQRASEFMMRLHKRLVKEDDEDSPGIKELFFQNCMTQIKLGLQDIEEKNQQMLRAAHFDIGVGQSVGIGALGQFSGASGSSLIQQNMVGQNIQPLHPDLANSASIDSSRNKIARSIKLLSQFIQEFEGLHSREGGTAGAKGRKAIAVPEVTIQVTNQISNSRGPKKIDMTLPATTKIIELKEKIAEKLNPPQTGSDLSLLFRGKDLTENLKTLKDEGMKSQNPDGSNNVMRIILTLQESFLGDGLGDTGTAQEPQYTTAQLNEGVESLKTFMPDLTCSEEVMKLALKKCKLDLNEVFMMLTGDQIEDLEEEVRAEQEANSKLDLISNPRVGLADQIKNNDNEQDQEQEKQELRLNEMISNRSECFDLLFGLLNLGVADITTASWSLLTQVPINQQLLSKIRLLDESSSIMSDIEDKHLSQNIKKPQHDLINESSRQMSQMEWSQIIDPNGIHKMLYSLQLVNQLITINNEKLSEAEIHERFDWRQRFLQLGGFDHLYFILITYNFDQIDDMCEQASTNQLQQQQQRRPEEFKEGELERINQTRKQKGINQKANILAGPSRKPDKSQSNLYKRTQAQCLGHLISIIKIFLQAAILSDDERNLLTLIASSSTSPFKKQNAFAGQGHHSSQSNCPENAYGDQSASGGENHSDKDTSSVNTPKFANSFTSTTPPVISGGQGIQGDQEEQANASANEQGVNTSFSGNQKAAVGAVPARRGAAISGVNEGTHSQAINSTNAQVDDFPKLLEQMRQNGIASLILQNVDFSSLVRKLLQIIQISTCIFSRLNESDQAVSPSLQGQNINKASQNNSMEDSVPQLILNSLDLMLPCILWEPQNLMSQLYIFEGFEKILIQGLIHNQSEKIRKSIESTFKTLCYHIQGQEVKQAKNKEQLANLNEPDGSSLNNLEGNKPVSNSNDAFTINYTNNPKLHILKILISNLPKVTARGKVRNLENQYFDEYFNLMSSLIKICKEQFQITEENNKDKEELADSKIVQKYRFFFEDQNKFDSISILSFCIEQIQTNDKILSGIYDKKVTESKQSASERLLQGYLQLCQSLLEVIPSLKEKAANECQLISTITDFIFNTNSNKSSSRKKQLCRQTRKRAVGLLLTLCEKNESNFAIALKILYNFHEQIEKSWQHIDFKEFDSDVGIKQASGYVGLKNFGCTCYMNALLQQLYMIPDLRNAVIEIQLLIDGPSSQEQLDDNVLHQLRCIFANLQESEKSYFVPKGFVETFKFYGEPINVRVQQDTHEFYNVLCDQIEQLIPKPKQSNEGETKADQDQIQSKDIGKPEDKNKQNFNNFLKKTVGGTLCNETRSLEAEYPYVGERDEDFYAITLDIKNKKTIQEALDLYIKPDILEGDNKYHCEQHDRLISAQRRTYLKDLSNTVVINLKRFEFDYNTMQRLKVNDYCEFPEKINFKPWTKEGIEEARKREKLDKDDVQDEDQNADVEELQEADDLEHPSTPHQDIEAFGGDGSPKRLRNSAGVVTGDKEVDEDALVNEQENMQNFILESVNGAGASGGSRQSGKRRVRSSTKKRVTTTESEKLLTQGKVDEPLNLSAEFDEIDTTQDVGGKKVNIIRARRQQNQRGDKEQQAIIDEDAFSEDAKSVDSKDQNKKQLVQVKVVGSEKGRGKEKSGGKTGEKRDDRGGSAYNFGRDNVKNPEQASLKKKKQQKDAIDKYEYQLVGVLVHSGGADAGHYYSFIKERNKNSQNYGKWFEFNDTVVKQFSLQNLKKECFGGQQQQNNYNDFGVGSSQIRTYQRCANAYLIFYERVHKLDVQEERILQRKNSQSVSLVREQKLSQELVQEQIFRKIHEENQAFKHLKIFSDNDFIKFMLDYINLCQFQEVFYFPQENYSDSYKMVAQRDLIKQYVTEWETKRKIVGPTLSEDHDEFSPTTPKQIEFDVNYAEQQRIIRASKRDVQIFNQKENLDDFKTLSSVNIGLKTIQLATVLAQDIILQLKDTQAFVQLVQKLNIMYQSHAIASVWFLKWITEQEQVLQRVLLGSHIPEVREVFATLLSNTFSISVKNEETYIGEVEQQYDLDCNSENLQKRELRHFSVQRSAALRLIRLLTDEMMHCARVNWRNFTEYFILLKEMAQCHFKIAWYLIQNGYITKLLEFVMNGKPPFQYNQGGSVFRMGDIVQQPDFQPAYSLLSYLIRCCLTDGITTVQHYSPLSIFEEEEKCIKLTENQLKEFFTSECQQEILSKTHLNSEGLNQSIEEIILHLSWGDINTSVFFIQEIIDLTRTRRSQVNLLDFHLRLLEKLIELNDSKEIKSQRIDFLLKFNEVNMSQSGFGQNYNQNPLSAGPSSGSGGTSILPIQHSLGMFAFLYRQQGYPIYRLKLLNFIGQLALNHEIVLNKLKEQAQSYKDWVCSAIQRATHDTRLIDRAQMNFRLHLSQLAQATQNIFGKITGVTPQQEISGAFVEDEVAAAAETDPNQKHFEKNDDQFKLYREGADIQLKSKTQKTGAVNLEDVQIEMGNQNLYESDGEETIYKLAKSNKIGSIHNIASQGPDLFTQQKLNDSFSDIKGLVVSTQSHETGQNNPNIADDDQIMSIPHQDIQKQKNNDQSFADYGDEDYIPIEGESKDLGRQNYNLSDADDQQLRACLGHLDNPKPSLEHRQNAAFPRAQGSNPYQAEQDKKLGGISGQSKMARIDLTKIQPSENQQPGQEWRNKFDGDDGRQNQDQLGDTMQQNSEDEVLISGFTPRQIDNRDNNVEGQVEFGTNDQTETFAFENNSADFALSVDNDIDLGVGGFDDFLNNPEMIKRQMEEFERLQKLNKQSKNQKGNDQLNKND